MTALYIHIPFCEKKCFYCSFVVTIAQQQRMDAYVDCLEKEMQRYRGQRLKTIYLGGGTPTLLDQSQLRRIIEAIRKTFLFDRETELTIEANPEGVDLEKAYLLLDLGVNRISLGTQSFHDHYLKFLGRCHDARMAVETFTVLRKAGFKNINVDLMYSFPRQTMEEIESDVGKLIEFASEHVSLYTLTVDPHSRFHAKKMAESENHLQAEQYERVVGLLAKAGLPQYEVSNFARPGQESRHNLIYWTGGNYIGIGVGAHSHQDGERRWNIAHLPEYIACLQTGGDPMEGFERLSREERLVETLLFGLRMNRGIHLQQLQNQLGCVLPGEKMHTLQTFIEGGWLIGENDLLKATDKGRLVLDEMAARLI